MIQVRELGFRYPGASAAAVEGLEFQVEPGEIFGFLGPSGAGKSTTQKILIGLLRDYVGSVSVVGRDLRRWRSDDYEGVGVSFEVPNLYLKLTARENLDYFASLFSQGTQESGALLEQIGLADEGDLRVSQFSKGMKVRLGFVRALLNRPKLLFLDEPTAGLDPGNARVIKGLIREQCESGTTVFLTTHDMAVADELCDRVAFIVDGSLRRIGSPRELKLSYGRRTVRVEYLDGEARGSREFPMEALGQNADFLGLLRERDIQTLHSQEPTLENVFLEVTGRGLL